MVDPAHGEASDAPHGGSGGDRDVKIEELLLAGLDHYFKGQYERAIDVWTRVLFLDRTHARARAYIDRARASLAERQRESEELVHTGVEAFQRGDVGEARELLESAVERGGPRDEALSVLDRLDRLETAAGQSVPRESLQDRVRRARGLRRPVERRNTGAWLAGAAAVFGILLLGGFLAVWSGRLRPGVFSGVPAPASVPDMRTRASVPTPASTELLLARARRLADEQRPYDALRLLDVIGPGDPLRADADGLRARIQQALLAGVEAADPSARQPPVTNRAGRP